MEQFDNMKKETMRRIYVIFLLRKAVGRTALKAYALGVLVWFQTLSVSVRSILANMPKEDPVQALNFYSAAFMNTTFGVQLLTVAIVALLALLSVDLFPRRAYSR